MLYKSPLLSDYVMDETTNQIAKKAQHCISTAPVILLGSGASAPFDIPNMPQLADHLVSNVSFQEQNEIEVWKKVVSELAKNINLEEVLATDGLPEEVVDKVIIHTWDYISKADEKMFRQLLSGNFSHPISKLFQCILRSGEEAVEIVTTNYDRIIEYACSATKIHCNTGLHHGYAWQFKSEKKLELCQNQRKVQSVNLRKVHGSLDWFKRADNSIIHAPLFEYHSQELKPLIVTPGISKYEKVQYEPFRTINREADDVLEGAKGYLCIGFGFRDRHIDEKMRNELTERNLPIVVITKQATKETNTLIEQCSAKNYLILEEDINGTLARTNENPSGVLLKEDFWSIEGFIKFMT